MQTHTRSPFYLRAEMQKRSRPAFLYLVFAGRSVSPNLYQLSLCPVGSSEDDIERRPGWGKRMARAARGGGDGGSGSSEKFKATAKLQKALRGGTAALTPSSLLSSSGCRGGERGSAKRVGWGDACAPVCE